MSPTVNDNHTSSPAEFSAIRRETFRQTAKTSWLTQRIVPLIGGLICISTLALLNCGGTDRRTGIDSTRIDSKTHGHSPFVVALGNLGRDDRPTEAEMRLSEFLFGTVPEPALGLVKPVALASRGDELLICDSALNAVFHFQNGELEQLRLNPPPQKPVGIDVAPDGGLAIADTGTNAVLLYDASGSMRLKLAASDDAVRPADAVFTGDEVWVSNAASSRIDVFDLSSGAFVRSIGARGGGRGQFGVPLGMARSKDGGVFIVDMLNVRIQLLSADGRWKRNIGRAGDRVGSFGRPKDVAVGPDGTIFVVDSASQRVHAFSAEGQPILAFGGPGSGDGALSMPAGICIAPVSLISSNRIPSNMPADYLIAVAEQLDTPGIRMFAWCATAVAQARDRDVRQPTVRRVGTADAPNPHWAAKQCVACHQMTGSTPLPIASNEVDKTCLSCHDGHRASAEPHPIGRLANHSDIKTPSEWPLNDDRLSCITCHDIQKHCSPSAKRPVVNPTLLRYHEPEKPLAFCTQCHVATDAWRLSPHDQIAPNGSVRTQTCTFCHSSTPSVSTTGRRMNAPNLREPSSGVCLTCHTKHWDYSPEGHVERPTTKAIRSRMGAQSGDGSTNTSNDFSESVLPLTDRRVTCYTCHNPHAPGLFPRGSQLGSHATVPADAAISLRVNRTDLCLSCHLK